MGVVERLEEGEALCPLHPAGAPPPSLTSSTPVSFVLNAATGLLKKKRGVKKCNGRVCEKGLSFGSF